jgi:amidase
MTDSKKRKLQRPWQKVAQEAQNYRDSSLARVQPGLPEAFERIQFSGELPKNSTSVPGKALHPRDFRITEKLPEELLKSLASGELSAVDVTTAFLRRAVLAQKLVSSSRSDPFVKSIATYQYATDKLYHRASP